MARDFTGSTDKVSFADSGGAFFDNAAAWSLCVPFQTDSITATLDIVAKNNSPSNSRQFLMRLDTSGNVEVYESGGGSGWSTVKFNIGPTVVGTYYCAFLTNDGGGGAGGLRLLVMEYDETVLGDSTDSFSNDANTLSADVQIGNRTTGTAFNGRIGPFGYFDIEMTTQQCKEYLHGPHRFAASHIANCLAFLPLIGDASPEPDWSGNGRSGTVAGTPGVGANPPVAPWYGFDTWTKEAIAAAGGGLSIPVAMHHYKQIMGVN